MAAVVGIGSGRDISKYMRCGNQGRKEGVSRGFRKPLKFLNTLLKLET